MGKLFARYRSSSRTRKKTTSPFPAAGVFLLSASAVALYCVLFPSGLWGKPIKGFLATSFGFGRYFFPILTGYVGLRLSLSRPWAHGVLRTTLWVSLFTFGVSFVSLFSQVAYHENAGGLLGLAGSAFLARLFGTAGAWLVTFLGLGLTAAALVRVSPIHVAERLVARLRFDWNEWKLARQEVRSSRGSVVKPRPLVAETTPVPRSTPSVVQSVPSKSVAMDETKPSSKAVLRPSPEPRSPAAQKAQTPVETAVPVPYQLPPLDLLSDPPHRTVKLSESELVEKSRVLEQTLANFGVEARTTDIHPGPVITRFDLEPAPGVKISSIVNLSNDIALAMKATRVRVLAPIPGKGAVGVEIPNPEMVTVTLKEILADSRFQSSRSPLAVS
jgi:S-DNA-T family DNA segregation ATPase FtsK/SpoIIIE